MIAKVGHITQNIEMDIVIRPATLADARTIASYNAALAWETEHLRLEHQRLTAGVQALLADRSKGFYVMAEADGKPVGQTMVTYEFSDWRNGVFWWIQSVYVAAAFRGKGVFREIYRHLESRAKADSQVCGLRLYVERANLPAQNTYTRLGMRPAGYEMFEVDFILERGTGI